MLTVIYTPATLATTMRKLVDARALDATDAEHWLTVLAS
jgi:hypothetical protein